MDKPLIEPLMKQMHEEEKEIDALERKIQAADLTTTYPHEYAEMRATQEQHRQQILKCKATLDDPLARGREEDPSVQDK